MDHQIKQMILEMQVRLLVALAILAGLVMVWVVVVLVLRWMGVQC